MSNGDERRDREENLSTVGSGRVDALFDDIEATIEDSTASRRNWRTSAAGSRPTRGRPPVTSGTASRRTQTSSSTRPRRRPSDSGRHSKT